MYQYINGVEKFIYITGWSVYTQISLVRGMTGIEGVTVGELLKYKAEQGVRVLVLKWEDRTTVKTLKREGLMKNHCEETLKFFKKTKNNFDGTDLRRGEPREPWHDAHSKIEGLTAWDVVTNFTQRWIEQADPRLLLDLQDMKEPKIPEGTKT
ncbi:hypothetical protein KI387_027722 [Taxus chinensis]|uniref:Uncharacterized protein n=1 Tax=Taxus chinensis TaxID=29808 RepID=A0AA38FY45_TAXCH|nr:hypothetical protein KI387_027722 [Taxus chinensis]